MKSNLFYLQPLCLFFLVSVTREFNAVGWLRADVF
jgi:hypothetical protein